MFCNRSCSRPWYLGWIGTEKRLEFTAIDDSINTARRIQENSEKDQVLLSRPAYDCVKDQVKAKRHARLTTKGKSQSVDVYEIVGLK